MLSMAYTAARDSQEGVLCKLLDELRDNATKEAALAVTALLLMGNGAWIEQQYSTPAAVSTNGTSSSTAASSNGSSSSSSNAGASFSRSELDHACEAFLQRRFGVQVRGVDRAGNQSGAQPHRLLLWCCTLHVARPFAVLHIMCTVP
jgi:hypothetical protein